MFKLFLLACILAFAAASPAPAPAPAPAPVPAPAPEPKPGALLTTPYIAGSYYPYYNYLPSYAPSYTPYYRSGYYYL